MTKDSRKDESKTMSRSTQGKGRRQQGGQSGSGGKQQQQQSPGSRQPGGGNSDDIQEDSREFDGEGNRGGRNPQVDIERE
jgi:hypothetical protein